MRDVNLEEVYPGAAKPALRPEIHASNQRSEDPEVLEILCECAAALMVHGQTTERMIRAVERLAGLLNTRVTVFPEWGRVTIMTTREQNLKTGVIAAEPFGVDMSQVSAISNLILDFRPANNAVDTFRSRLNAVSHLQAVSAFRFVLFGAAGGAALSVLFGESHPLNLLIIAVSAGTGALLRRWVGNVSHNILLQPFSAALLAGFIAAAAARYLRTSSSNLIALCPCMILTPGIHILNGALDLVHGRVPLGISRFVWSGLIILMICTGLFAGLFLGGVPLSITEVSRTVPLSYDVLAAGIAVAAYGTSFSMPWRMLPIPIAIGMLAHASRWFLTSRIGIGQAAGSFVACIIIGAIVTPVADRLHLPFAAFAFASGVSLLPGVLMFRMAGGLVALAGHNEKVPYNLLLGTVEDGTTAFLVILAMIFGLVLPKVCIERLRRDHGLEPLRY